MATLSFKIRAASPDDINFIYSTWLESFNDSSLFGIKPNSWSFKNFYQNIIDLILAKPDCEVAVAADSESPEAIYAYLVFEPGIIHYAYTKGAFQMLGIMKRLVDFKVTGKEIKYTHKTKVSNKITLKHPELIYQCSLIFKGENNGPTGKTETPIR